MPARIPAGSNMGDGPGRTCATPAICGRVVLRGPRVPARAPDPRDLRRVLADGDRSGRRGRPRAHHPAQVRRIDVADRSRVGADDSARRRRQGEYQRPGVPHLPAGRRARARGVARGAPAWEPASPLPARWSTHAGRDHSVDRFALARRSPPTPALRRSQSPAATPSTTGSAAAATATSTAPCPDHGAPGRDSDLRLEELHVPPILAAHRRLPADARRWRSFAHAGQFDRSLA
jgi:hypothetical protein